MNRAEIEQRIAEAKRDMNGIEVWNYVRKNTNVESVMRHKPEPRRTHDIALSGFLAGIKWTMDHIYGHE